MADEEKRHSNRMRMWAGAGCLLGLMLLGPLGPVLFPIVFPLLLVCAPRPKSVAGMPWWLAKAAFYALGGPFLALMFWAEEVAKQEERDASEVLIELLGGVARNQRELPWDAQDR